MRNILLSLAASAALISGALLLPSFSLANGPWIHPSTHNASPGQSFNVSGGGFGQNEGVNISLAGGSMSRATTNATGGFSSVPVTVPQVSARNYSVLATGDNRDQASANFYISGYYPRAHPSRWYILPGQSLSFFGTGFAPDESVTIDDHSSSIHFQTTADQNGNLNLSNALSVPYRWASTKQTFVVSGSLSGASIPLTITVGSFYPQIQPSSYWLPHGSSFSVAGTGFAPNEMVSLFTNGALVSQARANNGGTVGFSVNAPQSGTSATLTAQGMQSGASSSRTIYLY